MIARIWRGWTAPADADAYETLLREEVLPGIAAREIPGYHGPHLMRRKGKDEVEFVTVLWFDSFDAVRAFQGGDDPERAYVPPEARRLLSRFEERSSHYDVVLRPRLDGSAVDVGASGS